MGNWQKNQLDQSCLFAKIDKSSKSLGFSQAKKKKM